MQLPFGRMLGRGREKVRTSLIILMIIIIVTLRLIITNSNNSNNSTSNSNRWAKTMSLMASSTMCLVFVSFLVVSFSFVYIQLDFIYCLSILLRTCYFSAGVFGRGTPLSEHCA